MAMTIEQQRALALARARLRVSQPEQAAPELVDEEPAAPSWRDVVRSAPVKAFAGAADTALNAMLGPGRMTNMMLSRTAPPEITPYTGFGRQTGAIADTRNMTPGQKIADVGLQAATGALFGPSAGLRATAANMLASGLTAGGGEIVSQATGSPTAGLILLGGYSCRRLRS